MENEVTMNQVDQVINEPVDGVTLEQIEKWKQMFKKVYEVDIMDDTYIYRGITRPEVRRISQEVAKKITHLRATNVTEIESQGIVEELLQEMQVRMCTLFPDLSMIDFNDPSSSMSLAGVVPALAQAIDEASGGNITIIPREL